jgi:hypothetical protein
MVQRENQSDVDVHAFGDERFHRSHTIFRRDHLDHQIGPVSDARPSSLAEIKPGDQVRVLGNRGADGLSYAAERIVSGSFLQFAGTINFINLAAGELVVKDLGTKKNISVRISADSIIRRLPSTMAASLAASYRQNGGRGALREPGRGGASEDLGQALDHLPAMPVTELKSGTPSWCRAHQGRSQDG